VAETDIFRYDSFTIQADGKTVDFIYELIHAGNSHTLKETFVFPVTLPKNNAINAGLRALHIALGISYYKTFLPPNIMHPYKMDVDEAEFWNDIFTHGLGEFLYTNKLSADQLARFSEQDGSIFNPDAKLDLQEAALLGIGGGKDSIVAGELLKKIDVPLTGFVMATGEQLGQSKAVADIMGIELLAVERTLDQQLLQLQEQPGAYKGHVPISLIFGLVGTVLAVAKNQGYIVVANEASASIPSTTWNGTEINHQWSKSFGFEQKLQRYLKTYVTPQLTYFSAIRPLSSIAVAQHFAHYPQYFEAFTSDNTVFRIDPSKRPHGRWSLESPKSLSSYILLAPWMSAPDVERTFGRDFLNEASLEKLFLEMVGVEGEPPLDCVGTVDELVLSMNLLAKQKRYTDSYLMKLAHTKHVIREEDWDAALHTMSTPYPDQAFPEALTQVLETELPL
jgi:hypothetical protein